MVTKLLQPISSLSTVVFIIRRYIMVFRPHLRLPKWNNNFNRWIMRFPILKTCAFIRHIVRLNLNEFTIVLSRWFFSIRKDQSGCRVNLYNFFLFFHLQLLVIAAFNFVTVSIPFFKIGVINLLQPVMCKRLNITQWLSGGLSNNGGGGNGRTAILSLIFEKQISSFRVRSFFAPQVKNNLI